MTSFFPTQSGAPQMSDFIQFSDKGLKQAGVQTGIRDFTDQYQEASLAQYNNAYNYWLWQQQAMYNSPEQQVARLKAAGLNPNYNSIEGAGNLKDTPASKADIHSNLAEQSISKTNQLLNIVNSVLNGIKEGVQTVSQISAIPDDIKEYRKYLNDIAGETLIGKKINNALGTIQNAVNLRNDVGIDVPGLGVGTIFSPGITAPVTSYRDVFNEPVIEPNFDKANHQRALNLELFGKDLINQLRSGQLKINEQQLKNMEEQYKVLQTNADFAKWEKSIGIAGPILRVIFQAIGLRGGSPTAGGNSIPYINPSYSY